MLGIHFMFKFGMQLLTLVGAKTVTRILPQYFKQLLVQKPCNCFQNAHFFPFTAKLITRVLEV